MRKYRATGPKIELKRSDLTCGFYRRRRKYQSFATTKAARGKVAAMANARVPIWELLELFSASNTVRCLENSGTGTITKLDIKVITKLINGN